MATFKQAFADARKRLGPGKTFTHNGKTYTTDRADDKPAQRSATKSGASRRVAGKVSAKSGAARSIAGKVAAKKPPAKSGASRSTAGKAEAKKMAGPATPPVTPKGGFPKTTTKKPSIMERLRSAIGSPAAKKAGKK